MMINIPSTSRGTPTDCEFPSGKSKDKGVVCEKNHTVFKYGVVHGNM